jgi:hypothetical protein
MYFGVIGKVGHEFLTVLEDRFLELIDGIELKMRDRKIRRLVVACDIGDPLIELASDHPERH